MTIVGLPIETALGYILSFITVLITVAMVRRIH